MSYLKYTVREFQRSVGQFEVEKEFKCAADNIFTYIKVRFLSLIDVPGNAEALTQEHRAKGKLELIPSSTFTATNLLLCFQMDQQITNRLALVLVPLFSSHC